MADCGLNCEIEDCMFCLGMQVENSIFYEIQQMQEGEMDEEWYEGQLDVFRNQELENIIYDMTDETCEHIIFTYGIHKALEAYKDVHGCIEMGNVNFCKTLLYTIVDENLCVKFSDYQGWCKNHPVEEDDTK